MKMAKSSIFFFFSSAWWQTQRPEVESGWDDQSDVCYAIRIV